MQSNGTVSAHMVKIFVDGGLESCTAAFLENYSDTNCGTSHQGELIMSEPVIDAYVTALDHAGFQSHFHARFNFRLSLSEEQKLYDFQSTCSNNL